MSFGVLPSGEKLTFPNCDREPVHLLGAVQPHGCMLVLSESMTIQYASENVEKLVNVPLNKVLGRSITDILDGFHVTLEDIRAHHPGKCSNLLQYHAQTKNGQPVHLYVHENSQRLLLVELEIVHSESKSTMLSSALSDILERYSPFQAVIPLLEVVAKEVRGITGYDRVMVYEFDKDYCGTVVVESTDLPTRFLGLRFPATDIPVPARTLFIQNRVRFICNRNDTPVKVVPTGHPIDMTFSMLRTVSPVHIQYLKNLDVAASCSVSLLLFAKPEKQLWGLLVCHHSTPKNLTFHERQQLDILGKVVSLQIENILQGSGLQQKLQLANAFSEIESELRNHIHSLSSNVISDSILFHMPRLMKLFGADGCALLTSPGGCVTSGVVGLHYKEILETCSVGNKSFGTDNVSLHVAGVPYDPLCCGVLYVPLLKAGEGLLFTRKEVLSEILWAGEPKKPDKCGVLTPRNSFAQWTETVVGRSLPWSDVHLSYAAVLQAHLVRFIVDVERSQAQAEDAHRERQVVEQVAALQKAFLANVSHELRTPIHAILGTAELLTAPKDSETFRSIQTIQSTSEHLLAIVNDLLDIATFEARGVDIQNTPFCPLVQIENTLESIWPLAMRKGLALLCLVPPDFPTMVVSDPVRIRQILYNFMSNAVKFTTAGRVVLRVEFRSASSSDQIIARFSVEDTGIGIDDALQGRLFERFSQVDNSKTRTFGGTGLGLSLTKQVAEAMGGGVGVTSAPDHGSIFWAELPLALNIFSGSTEAPPTEPSNKRLQKLRSATTNSYAISVIESDEGIQLFLDYYFDQYRIKHIKLKYEAGKPLSKTANELLQRIDNYQTLSLWLSSASAEMYEALSARFPKAAKVLVRSTATANTSRAKDKDSGWIAEISPPLRASQLQSALIRIYVPSLDVHEAPPVPIVGPAPRAEKYSVLLVEDNPTNRTIAIRMLSESKYSVDTAADGALALQAIKQKCYDIVLMDVLMPVMDGITATRNIRKYEKETCGRTQVPIIGLTASPEASTTNECIEAGMDTVITKPFRKADLERELSRFLEKASRIPSRGLVERN